MKVKGKVKIITIAYSLAYLLTACNQPEQVDYTYEGQIASTINVTEIELCYGYTYDEETDRYALIPVWYYIGEDRSQDTEYYRDVICAINAMDGTAKDDVSVRIESY